MLQAALKIVDEEGVESLSIRKLAGKLGVDSASLYWYVRNKDDLLEGVVHLVFGNLEVPESDGESWAQRLRRVCRWYRQRLLEHPNVVATASFDRMFPLASAPLAVAMGNCLLPAGFEDEELIRVLLTIQHHTIGFVTLEVARKRFGFVPIEAAREWFADREVGGQVVVESVARDPIQLTGADVSRYRDLYIHQDMDALFEYSLDHLLAGLAAETPASTTKSRRRRAKRAPGP